jgi:protein tyrosine/serine phosphatase
VTRILRWDGCVNVRDLGGLPLEDGGETAYRVVVRADDVAGLGPHGWRALADYGVTCVVDLRWREELAADPPRGLDVETVHVALFGDIRAGGFAAKYDAYIDATDDPADWYRWSYREALADFRPRFAQAVSAIATAPGTAVVHCSGGKDRTGLVSALVLRLAGVPADAVVDDWALSGPSWAASAQAWIAEAPDEIERARRRIYMVAPPEAMRDIVADLDARAYLEDGGVPREQLDALRARLRGDA